MCSIIGVGDRLHKVLEADKIKTLVSMATKSSQRLRIGADLSTWSMLEQPPKSSETEHSGVLPHTL